MRSFSYLSFILFAVASCRAPSKSLRVEDSSPFITTVGPRPARMQETGDETALAKKVQNPVNDGASRPAIRVTTQSPTTCAPNGSHFLWNGSS